MTYKIENFYAIGDIQFEVSVDEKFNDIEMKFLDASNATLGPSISMLSPSKEVKKTLANPGKYVVEFHFKKTENSEYVVWRQGMIR